jgi:hypothetical protein
MALASAFVPSQVAEAAADYYEFQLVENEIKQGDGATITLRLVNRRTGAPVENAVVFATRLDMEPDGMVTMTAPVEAMPQDQPGLYRFKTNLIMAGGWRFSVAAKVQGEAETIQSRLVFKAVE